MNRSGGPGSYWSRVVIIAVVCALTLNVSGASRLAETPKRYYAHQAIEDRDGIIAPWYRGQNGQLDWRIRIAAETLKRYPWSDKPSAAPHYVFNGTWAIAPDGTISIPQLRDWDNGDLGQRAAYVLSGLVDYYRYSGDPAAIGHVWLTVEALRKHSLTDSRHPWPGILISVPTKGAPYGQANPKGMIQLDIVAEVGIGLVRAYQMVGKREWWDMAKRWADLFAKRRGSDPSVSPWARYANPEDAVWEDLQTGGVAFILEFLDEVIRLGYTGRNGEIVAARDAGRRYLRDVLLPRWTENDAWGRNYWDWNDPVQAENVTEFVCRYLMAHPGVFPNWRNDVRNILTLFLNRTSVDAGSGGGVFSGAWAYPESSGCCGRSLWYGPMELAPVYAELGHRTRDARMLEMARRMMLLATYDGHETGVVEDNIDGGQIVAGGWFKIAHPMALKHALNAIGWQPEEFGAPRENHIVRTTHVVRDVQYADGSVRYSTYPALGPNVDVLRLSFRPTRVMADGKPLTLRTLPAGARADRLGTGSATIRQLPHGDCLVSIRRDGTQSVVVSGDDPQTEHGIGARAGDLAFVGNQVRIVGDVGPDGGLAEVSLDGVMQRVPVDCWSPVRRANQVLYYRNGLENGKHSVQLRPLGRGNPVSKGSRVTLRSVLSSRAAGQSLQERKYLKPEAQRVIFGYAGRSDWRASDGSLWRPATEWIVRSGVNADSVVAHWHTRPTRATILGTRDPELYRYGAHAPDLTAFFTVAPGRYTVRLHFVETRQVRPEQRALDIEINGRSVARRLDLAATAGGMFRAAALAFRNVAAQSGTIAVRLKGCDGAEAIIHAIEVLPGAGPSGRTPVAVAASPSGPGNLLANGGFEQTVAGTVGRMGDRTPFAGWTYVFASPQQSCIWAETDYVQHPHLGMPEIMTGKQALRTHTDGDGHTMVFQDVVVRGNTDYLAEAWVRASDLHGKGFGRHSGDVAGLIVHELSVSGAVIKEHPIAAIRDAGPYRRVEVRFRTSEGTHRVRYILNTIQAAPYTEGHVTYDDCRLTAVESGTVKEP